MRCFISINIPRKVALKIAKFAEELKSSRIFSGSFVKPQNMHITLKFLGDIKSSTAENIKSALEQIKFREFEVCLVGLGAFPSKEFIRVLWVGVDNGSEQIVKLHREIGKKIAKFGFQTDAKFVPHLTLARVGLVNNKSALQEIINRNINFGTFLCNKIYLMKSELLPNGVVYSEI